MVIIDENNESKLKNDSIEVYNTTITYTQNNDTCSTNDENQKLSISTEDAGAGKYITIKTNRWAIDSIDDVITMINDFKQRSGIKGL